MAIVVGLEVALAIVLLVGVLPLILWARSSGHSVGRLMVVVLAVLVVLVAVFAVVMMTIKRRGR
jgi:hypothetical protein